MVLGDGLTWSDGPDTSLTYSVGKHRVKVFLGTDLVAAYADASISRMREQATTARDEWQRTLDQTAKDASLTEAQRKRNSADEGKKVQDARDRLAVLDTLDLDQYLYDLARRTFIADAEFGQLTHLLKKSVQDRRKRRGFDLLFNERRSALAPLTDHSGPMLAVRTSLRSADLLSSAWELTAKKAPALERDRFLDGRTVPFAWLLELLRTSEALELEMGQAARTLSRSMEEWEQGLDPDLIPLHRELVMHACCVRSLLDAVELEQDAKKAGRLRLKDGFIVPFMPALQEFQDLSARMEAMSTMDRAGLVVVGLGGSGKTTFLRRCYELLKNGYGNSGLNEEIDPKSTAFVVGHIFKDIEVPLLNGVKKGMTICWMDTAGAADHHSLGRQLTRSVTDMEKVFLGKPSYNLLFMWSCEPGYDELKDLRGFEDVFSHFVDEVLGLDYQGLQLPGRIFLLLNKADNAEKAGIAREFRSDHERCFLNALEQKGEGLQGESLGFLSALSVDGDEISRKLQTSLFGLSPEESEKAFARVRLGINQGVIANLLPAPDAMRFKAEVYDVHGSAGQSAYLKATAEWIDTYLGGGGKEQAALTRALLSSLRSFLGEVGDG